jgi:hypothetical protein
VTGTTQPRVVVLSLAYRPAERVVKYIHDLIDAGVDVDLLVAERRSTADIDLDPRVRVRHVLDVEAELPVRRIERQLVFRLPRRIVGGVRRRAAERPAFRKADAVLERVERGQRSLSRGVHNRLFSPVFKVTRPWVLVRKGRRPAEAFDLAGADRIVAADTPSVPLGWRLARRYPQIRATTALDRKPYVTD